MRLSNRIIFAYSDFHYLSLNCRSLIEPDNKNLAFVVQHGGFRAMNFILFTQTFEGKSDQEQSPIIILFGFTLNRNVFDNYRISSYRYSRRKQSQHTTMEAKVARS